MWALNCPTWAEIERERVAGPYEVRRSLLGYVWLVVDSRTGFVKATRTTREAAEERADILNRGEA